MKLQIQTIVFNLALQLFMNLLAITTNEITSDVLCFGEDNGTAYLQISGGTSPYIEDWNGANITQLSIGSYNYTITDANNCTFSDYIIINRQILSQSKS